MKKLLLLWVLGLAVLAGCAQQGLSQSELFEKKQECVSHKDSMSEVFKDGSFGNDARIEEIFYSKKWNSCYFVIVSSKGRFLFDYFSQKLVVKDMLISMMTDECSKDETCTQNLYNEMKSYVETLQDLKGE